MNQKEIFDWINRLHKISLNMTEATEIRQAVPQATIIDVHWVDHVHRRVSRYWYGPMVDVWETSAVENWNKASAMQLRRLSRRREMIPSTSSVAEIL